MKSPSQILGYVPLVLQFLSAGRGRDSFGALGIDRKPTRKEFEVLFDSAPNGVMLIDRDGIIVLVNKRMEKKFGYTRGELVGQSVETLIPERFRHAHLAFRDMFAREPEARPMGAGRDLFGRRKDGSEFPVEIGLNPIATRDGHLSMATVVDISARKEAADKLSAALVERDDLRRRIMQAQEQERLRLARELHDQTGQSLAAVMLELKLMEALLDDRARGRVRALGRQLEDMGRTLHRVAWELRPASIDELGLTTALANYISEWSAQYGIEADFYSGDAGLDELSEEIRTTLYRVVQEALTNVTKHAQSARNVSVVIERVDFVLRLMIEDDGVGFEADPTRGPLGTGNMSLGLAGMRERLSLIGGELEVESSIAGGTTIFARVTLDGKRAAA